MLSTHSAETSASACEVDTAQLKAVRVGVPAPFLIIAHDRHRNRALRGGDAFVAELRCPDGSRTAIPIDDAADGSYRAAVLCRQTGMHHLELTLKVVF